MRLTFLLPYSLSIFSGTSLSVSLRIVLYVVYVIIISFNLALIISSLDRESIENSFSIP